MREKNFQTYINQTVMMLAVLAFAMVYGSVMDFQFSRQMYVSYSAIGQFFAAFGELPAFVALSGGAALIFVRRKRVHKSWSVPLGILSALIFLGGLGLAIHEATDNVPTLPKWVAVVICTFAIGLCSYLMVKYAKPVHSRKIFRFAITIIAVTFLTLLIVNTIKVPWGRIRMRFIYETKNVDLFSPWWVFGNPLREKLIAEGVSKDVFRSCPSGHVASAACLILFSLFPSRSKSTRGQWISFIVGFLWTVVVAVTRIQLSEHYLTDTAIATLIFLVCEMLGIYFFWYRNRFFNAIWFFLCDHPNPLAVRKTKE